MCFLQFTFSWSLVFMFLSGLFAGAAIFGLIYLLIVLKTIKKVNNKQIKNVNENIVTERIENTKKAFIEAKVKGSDAFIYTGELVKKLAIDTASDFYPNSKYPLFELSMEEIKDLFLYINNRLDTILETKPLFIFKKLKISYILSINNTVKDLDANPIIQTTKKYKVKQALNSFKKVINAVNPFWWAKNLVLDSSMNLIINKLCLIIISIVGEETYKVYSKKAFNVDAAIDSGVDDIVSEIAGMEDNYGR